MKLSIIDRSSSSTVIGVVDGVPLVKKYPIFVMEPDTSDDVAEAMLLFGKLFKTYSKEE
jgi:hypothetical protein